MFVHIFALYVGVGVTRAFLNLSIIVNSGKGEPSKCLLKFTPFELFQAFALQQAQGKTFTGAKNLFQTAPILQLNKQIADVNSWSMFAFIFNVLLTVQL